MSFGKLTVKHAFGMNTKIKNCLQFVDDHQLVYVCGHQVVVMNTENKDQSFITGTTQPYQSLGISAISCSVSKKTIAIAEIVEPVGMVAFFDSQTLRRKKVLQYSELGSREIRCMAFSADGRLCLTQGAGPEWNLVLWNIEKSVKVIGSVKISLSDDNPVHQVSFCPWDSNVIIVIGKGLVRIFRITEGQLRPVSVNTRRDHANFISHTWLWDDKLLLGTEGGEILLLEGLEFRAVVNPQIAENANEPICPIFSLSATAKGFVAGTTDGQIWSFCAEEDTKEQYKREETYNLPKDDGGIVCIAVTTDDSLMCAVDSQQLYHFTVTNANVSKDGGSNAYDHLFTGFHRNNPTTGETAITGIDVALWKPIAVTCGKDYSVRVWNLLDRRIETSKFFNEEPSAITIHPSGLYVAIAFTDRIRLASILLDDIAVTKEFNVRGSQEIKFSRGGMYLAAANGANVQIFNTYTGALVSTLRGHTAKVRSIVWQNFDSKLITMGQEGTVYFWDSSTGKRSEESSFPGIVPITTGTALTDGAKAYTVSNERILKEIPIKKSFDAITGQEIPAKQPKDLQLDRYISNVVIDDSSKILFLGSGGDENLPGSIISILTVPNLASSYEVTPLHSSSITAMCLSKDGNMLFTGDASGSLIVSEIEKGKGIQDKAREGITASDFVDEILIRKSDLDDRRAKADELSLRVEELTLNNDHQLRLKNLEHKDKIENITDKFTAQLNTEKDAYAGYSHEKVESESEFRRQVTELDERHERELTNVENRYKAKLSIEATRFQQLANEIEESHKKWNVENNTLVESHQEYLGRLSQEYENKLNEEHAAQRQLNKEKSDYQSEFDLSRGNVETDGDCEIDEMKTRFENRLKQEEETSISLMADHAIMKKNLQMLNKDSEGQKEEIKRLRDKEIRLIDTIRSLEKDIQSHKKEIREREETITDKEKRIFDLKKKNQELEKFRFVLDYKIKELKLQIAPRENEILIMQRQIEDMDLELEQYHKSNLALNLMIGELKLKLEGLRKELLAQTGRVDINAKLLERFMRDLQEVWVFRGDPHVLKSRVVNLYRVYVQEHVTSHASGGEGGEEAGPQKQYNRDREQMERSIDALRKSLRTDAQMHKRDLSKMMRENVMLTKEMNDLRKESKTMKLQEDALVRALESGKSSNIQELIDMLGFAVKAPATAGAPPTENNGSSKGRRRSVRSTAIRHSTSAGGGSGKDKHQGSSSNFVNSKLDLNEAWRELDIQNESMYRLEEQLRSLCDSMSINSDLVMEHIDKEAYENSNI